MKLDKALEKAIWEALGNPQGWGSFQPDIGEVVHFVVPLPNGIPAEALVAARVGAPGYVAYQAQGSVAGQFAFIRIVNDPTSGKKLLVDAVQLDAFAANSAFIRVGMAAGAGAGLVTAKQIGGAAPTGVTMFAGNNAAPGGTVLSLVSPGHNLFSDPWQLDPGTEIGVVAGAVATGLNVAFYFRWLDV